jgi:energy-coupling factor transporter transmembrane protein EcfT
MVAGATGSISSLIYFCSFFPFPPLLVAVCLLFFWYFYLKSLGFGGNNGTDYIYSYEMVWKFLKKFIYDIGSDIANFGNFSVDLLKIPMFAASQCSAHNLSATSPRLLLSLNQKNPCQNFSDL